MSNDQTLYISGNSNFQVQFPMAYDTSACSGHLIADTVKRIKEYRALDGYGSESQLRIAFGFSDWLKVPGGVAKRTETAESIVRNNLLMLIPGVNDIPFFAHPIFVNWENSDEGDVVVDCRNFIRKTQTGDYVVTANLDFQMTMLRGALQVAWLREDPKFILNAGNYQMTVFGRWIATCLSRRFVLDEMVQMRLNVLSAFYYYGLFLDKRKRDDMDETEYYRMISSVARATRVLPEEVEQILTGLPILRDVRSFVELIKRQEILGTTRLEQLNPVLFLTAINGAWMGTNRSEIMSVAFEHPPTFIAVLYAALTEVGFKKTVFGEIARLAEKSNEAESFVDNVKHMIAIG
jgi:hypothetical protein